MISKIALGSPAIVVVTHLVAIHADITSTRFVRYPAVPTYKDLEAQNSLAENEELSRRLRHGGKVTHEYSFGRNDVLSGKLTQFLAELPDEAILAICSDVSIAAEQKVHIPLVDFLCPKQPDNLAYLISAMRHLDSSGGYILESEHSYHFYGASLLGHRDWHEFVGRCLLLEPLVDVRYFGHCLLDDFAALRISEHQPSQRGAPRVVAIL